MKPFKLIFPVLILFSLLIYGCKNEETIIFPIIKSDLTRSGKFITFTSNIDGDYDVFLAQVDANGYIITDTSQWVYPNNPYNLTNTINPGIDKQSNWSPNGRVLVYSSQDMVSGARQIYAFFFKADGSIDPNIIPNPHLLFSSGGNWDENPFFSPDGLYLVWDRREDNQNPIGVLDTSDFRDVFRGTINYDSAGNIGISNMTKLTNTVNGDEYDAKWSPRIVVQRIAYTNKTSVTSNDYEIWIMDPLNPSVNSVYYNPNRNGYPAWAPACDRIIFESDHGNPVFQIVVHPYPNSGGNPAILIGSTTENLRFPTWLPNGNLLAYIRINISTGNGNIYITSTGGGMGWEFLPANFANGDNRWPAW